MVLHFVIIHMYIYFFNFFRKNDETSQMLNKYDVLQEKMWTDTFPLRSKQEAVALDEGDKGKGIISKISAENPDTEYGEDSNELIEGNEPPVMYEMKLDEVNISSFKIGWGIQKL